MTGTPYPDLASLIAAEPAVHDCPEDRVLVVSSGVRGFTVLMHSFVSVAESLSVTVTSVHSPPALHRERRWRAPRARLSTVDHLRHRRHWMRPPADPEGLRAIARGVSGVLIAGTGPALSLLPVLASVGVRTAVFTDVTAALHAEQNGWHDNPLLARDRLEEARRLRLADRVLCLSEWCRYSMEHDLGLAPERLSILRQGVTIPDDRSEPPGVGGTERPLRLVCVGQPAERKGMDRLTAWLGDRPGTDVELHFIGDAPADTGDRRVTAHGLLPHAEVQDLLSSVDVLVHPTRRDQSANIIVEAAAHGVPAVAVSMGGISELIDDGVTGWLVPPSDDAALAAALDRLVAEPALIANVSAAARARAIECHDASRQWAGLALWLGGRDA